MLIRAGILLGIGALGIFFFWPVAPPVSKTPPQKTNRLAPEGVFFLTEYVSISHEAGIKGFAPGTKVVREQDLGDTLEVRDAKGTVLEVRKDQLTNDLDQAEAASRNDLQSKRLAAQAQYQAARSLFVIQARYGHGASVVDVTDRIRKDVLAGKTTVHSGNHLCGSDPSFGKVKTLILTYSTGSGSPQTISIREGESFSLSPSDQPVATSPPGEIRRSSVSFKKPGNPLHEPAKKVNPGGPKNPRSDVY